MARSPVPHFARPRGGRRLRPWWLWPKSDIDLLLLLDPADTGLRQAQLEQLVGLFWDIGLEIGHSVRTNECLRKRPPT